MDLDRSSTIAALSGQWKRNKTKILLKYKGKWRTVLRSDLMQQVCSYYEAGSDDGALEIMKNLRSDAWGAWIRKDAFVVIDSATDG